MKKKALIGTIIGVIIAIVLILVGINIFVRKNNEKIIKKGVVLYGTSQKCDRIHGELVGIEEGKCKLCDKISECAYKIGICESCSEITNRCIYCGKINAKQKKSPGKDVFY